MATTDKTAGSAAGDSEIEADYDQTLIACIAATKRRFGAERPVMIGFWTDGTCGHYAMAVGTVSGEHWRFAASAEASRGLHGLLEEIESAGNSLESPLRVVSA